jgi:hypothetical protein
MEGNIRIYKLPKGRGQGSGNDIACLEFGNFVITLIYIVLNTASGSNSSSPNKHEYCISE